MPTTSAQDPPGTTRWVLAHTAPAQRRDAWADAIRRTHLDWSLDPREGTLAPDAALTRRRLGALALVDCVAGPGAGARTARHVRDDGEPWVGVLVVLEGSEHLEVGEERVTARPGDVVVWDSRVPTRFRVPGRLVKRTLLVPRSRLPVAESSRTACAAGLLPPSPATALRVDHLAAVVARCEDGDGLPPAVAHAAGVAAVELLAAALAPADDRTADDGAAWARVLDLVEDRLGDPGLGPRSIAAATGMSLRTVHALFERHGRTVAGHVRARRVERAHADLLRLGPRTGVAAVAARWGFLDAGTFTRAYRRAYGVPPSVTARR